MVGVEEARARMRACVPALCCEPVALAAAVGRTLGETLSAERDQPPFRSSAMDGYALRAADLALRVGAAGFRVVGQSAAGKPYVGAIAAGEAVRIFTGAPVPQGADWVVPQERARLEGATLIVDDQLPRSANIRAVATDFRAGERLITAGTRLNARHIALIAAAGVPAVNASRIPRVGLLATGTEILAPGAPAGPYQIYDSVTFGLAAMIEGWGGHALRRGAVADEDDAVAAAAAQGLDDADLLVIAGGASVGDYDVVKRALARLGLEILVSQVAVRPGKPTWFGTLNGKPILGLPGNPAAAFVCACLFLQPLLDSLLGRSAPRQYVAAVLDGVVGESGANESYLRASASVAAAGRLMVRPFDNQDTSLVSVFAAANALIRRPAGAPRAAHGATVEALLLDCLR
ncbi:MAG: gephyrin-like molybdotransferase Glp [Steroidobacteraceae bacterium]